MAQNMTDALRLLRHTPDVW